VGDWRQALTAARTLPASASKVKKQVIFRILNERGMLFMDHPDLMSNAAFVKSKLLMPSHLIYVVRA